MGKISLNGGQLVDNELLNAQHKVILLYMAKIYLYLLAQKKGKDLFELVARLDAYCKLHFVDEEKIMAEMDFPEFVDHNRDQQALFVTNLENYLGSNAELNLVRNIDEAMFLKGLSFRKAKRR